MFLESHPQKVADLGSDCLAILVSSDCKTPWLGHQSWSPIPIPWRTEHLCGMTIKDKWERDALRPGIRLFLESRTLKKLLIWAQIVWQFWSCRIAKHPRLTAILVPDSNTIDDRTPLWHNDNNQRQGIIKKSIVFTTLPEHVLMKQLFQLFIEMFRHLSCQ